MASHRISLPARRWDIGVRSPVAFDAGRFTSPAFGDVVEIEVTEGPDEDQGTYVGLIVGSLDVDGVGSLAGTVTCPWCGAASGSKCSERGDKSLTFHATRVFHAIANPVVTREHNLPVVFVELS